MPLDKSAKRRQAIKLALGTARHVRQRKADGGEIRNYTPSFLDRVRDALNSVGRPVGYPDLAKRTGEVADVALGTLPFLVGPMGAAKAAAPLTDSDRIWQAIDGMRGTVSSPAARAEEGAAALGQLRAARSPAMRSKEAAARLGYGQPSMEGNVPAQFADRAAENIQQGYADSPDLANLNFRATPSGVSTKRPPAQWGNYPLDAERYDDALKSFWDRTGSVVDTDSGLGVQSSVPADAAASFRNRTMNAAGGAIKRADGGGLDSDAPSAQSFLSDLARNPRGWGTKLPLEPEMRSALSPEADRIGSIYGPEAGRRYQDILDASDTGKHVALGLSGLGMANEGMNDIVEGSPGKGAAKLGVAASPFIGGPVLRGLGTALKYSPKATGLATLLGGATAYPAMGGDKPASAGDVLAAPVDDQIKQLMDQKEKNLQARQLLGGQRADEIGGKGKGKGAGHGPISAGQDAEMQSLIQEGGKIDDALANLRMRSDPKFIADMKQTEDAKAVKDKMLAEGRSPFEQAHPDLAANWWLAPVAAGATTAGLMRVPPAVSQRLQAGRWWDAVGAANAARSEAGQDAATTLAQKYMDRIPQKNWGSHLGSYAAPMGLAAAEGAGLSNAPDFYNLFLPPDNPERRAYEEYVKRLPDGSPEIARTRQMLSSMPEDNPARKMAVEHFANIKPALVKGLEGGLESVFGAGMTTTGAKAIGPFESGLPRADTEALLAKTASRGKPAYPGPESSGSELASAPPTPLLPSPGAASPTDMPALGETGLPLKAGEPVLGLPERSADVSKALTVAKSQPSMPTSSPDLGTASEKLPPGLARDVNGQLYDKHTGQKVYERYAKAPGKAEVEPELDVTPTKVAKQPKAPKAPKDKGNSLTNGKDEAVMDENGNWVKPPKEPDPNGPGNFAKGGSVMGKALALARKYANGGAVVGSMVGATGGRADKLPVNVPAGAYVLPADVVSGMPSAGGNTLAGLKQLESMFGPSYKNHRSAGGEVPIMISHGEYVVSPEQVAKLGGGNMDAGHRALDGMVGKIRNQNIQTLSTLPPPSK